MPLLWYVVTRTIDECEDDKGMLPKRKKRGNTTRVKLASNPRRALRQELLPLQPAANSAATYTSLLDWS